MFDETIIHDFFYPLCSIALFVKVKNSTFNKRTLFTILKFQLPALANFVFFFRFIMMAKGIWS